MDHKQHDVTDCGAACLAYVFDWHALRVPISALRQKAGTNRSGTTALGLVETAKLYGFEAKGVRCRFDDLRVMTLPGIAHVMLSGGRQHYVVVCGVRKKVIRVMDPAVGRMQSWPIDKFKGCWTNVFIVLSPGGDFVASSEVSSAWSRLLSLLAPQKAVLAQAFVGVVLTTILSLASTIYIQKIVDNVIVDGNRNLLRLLSIGMFVVLGLRVLIGYFQSLLMLRSAQRIDAGLILGYYRHLMRLPQSFFDTMRVGEITSRLRDAVAVRDFLNNTILSLVLNPLILIVALGAMFAYSWRLALFSLALVPFNVVIYLVSDWLNRRYQREIMERSADFQSQVVESLHAMSVVRSCGMEEEMSFRSETRFVRVLKRVWSAANAGFVVGGAGSFVTQAYSIGLLWIGAGLVLDSQLTAGELMSCNALAGYITGPLVAIIGMNSSIRMATTATDRLYEVLDLEREKDEGTAELTLDGEFAVRLDKLTFRYPGRLATLDDVSLEFESGTITALVGKSGCGKSTLLAMLQRHYLPGSGSIFVGNVELQYVRLESLRRNIAYVPQKIDLLAGTVLENVAPNERQPDMPRVVTLCREVGILDFIESLPQGFQTVITENGANLSGGQKQRLAIVRALYSDARIVLMDEPSSALDAESEEILVRALSAMRDKGKLIILAVHNRRILSICDRVVEIADGRVERVLRGSECPSPILATRVTESSQREKVEPRIGIADESATAATKALFLDLRDDRWNGILLGQTDANVMGVDEAGKGWFLADGRCDFHATTGRWPAVFGFEIPELTRGWMAACGYIVPKIQEAHRLGGRITVAWYPENLVTGSNRWQGSGVADILPGGSHHPALVRRLDEIAANLGNLRDAAGNSIPILFRCWPQSNGDRFWWGRSRCTPEEYARLFRFTVTYLRDVRCVHNFLYTYGVYFGHDQFDPIDTRYPGDEYVDVVGLDRLADDSEAAQQRFLAALSAVVDFAEVRRKVCGVTASMLYKNTDETGLTICSSPNWLELGLLEPLRRHPRGRRARFIVFWRNDGLIPARYQIPPPNSPHAECLRRIAADPNWRFADDLHDARASTPANEEAPALWASVAAVPDALVAAPLT